MAGYRDYGVRLASLGSMRRVTSTMKLVAAAHLHRAQANLHAAEPYAQAVSALAPLLRRPAFAHHRLVAEPLQVEHALLMVVSSNRGLCGAFNLNLARMVRSWLSRKRSQVAGLRTIFIGRKGHLLLRAENSAAEHYQLMPGTPGADDVARLMSMAVDPFLEGRYDVVYLAGNTFRSTAIQVPVVRRLLPLDLPPVSEDEAEQHVVLEPSAKIVFERLARQWAGLQVMLALLHSAVGEHAARVLAMENASGNLRSLESELTLLRNRARQAAITKELSEVVGGAEALA